jgi:hypothetical protein
MVIGIVACHRAPEVEPWPTRELGDYSYRISATPVYGKFTILPDTVTVDAQQESCRRVGTGVRDSWVHHFRCFGGSAFVDVTINSRVPLLSTWSTATVVKKTTEICTKYTTTIEGERVCTSRRTEVKTETVRSGGKLDVTRIASADKP